MNCQTLFSGKSKKNIKNVCIMHAVFFLTSLDMFTNAYKTYESTSKSHIIALHSNCPKMSYPNFSDKMTYANMQTQIRLLKFMPKPYEIKFLGHIP